MAPPPQALSLEQVSKSYGHVPVLTDLSISAESGEMTVIYGPPASGKSVLVRVLTGLEHPDSGRIILRGEDVTHLSPADRNIGYVPQSFALYPHLTVRRNIAYPLDLAGAPAAEARDIAEGAAAILKITEHLDKTPDQLSGGQKQRVAIARGIAKRTDVFVLDDPLAGLDFKLREQLVDDLRELKAVTGASIIYVTSDIIEAMTLADHLAVLANGSITESGEPEALYREPRQAATMALVGFPPANFLRGAISQQDGVMRCETALFSFPTDVDPSLRSQDVLVGLRPERIHLSHRLDNGKDDAEPLQITARVILREDLGGEDIVYLAAAGLPLTMVDRDRVRGEDLDAEVAISIFPHHLAIFSAQSGVLLGHGKRTAPAPVHAAARGDHG